MWISIRTKRIKVSSRMRESVESYIRRAFQRERRYVGSIVVGLRPAKLAGDIGYECRLAIWSHYLGLTVVSDVGDTVRTALQQTSLRAREVVRRRLHKRRGNGRRLKRDRFSRWLPSVAQEGSKAGQ